MQVIENNPIITNNIGPKKKVNTAPMKNITINIPDNYDKNIQKLIKMKLIPSRSEAVRIALRDFLRKEYNENLKLLDFFGED